MKSCAILLFALLVTSCSGASQGELQGAANPIPLYQPARLQKLEPTKSEWLENNKFDTNEWVWKASSPSAEVIAFYKTKIPTASQRTEGDDTVFRWTSFPGAETDEVITIVVEKDGIFRVSEQLPTSKHKPRWKIIEAFPKDNDVKSKEK